MNIFVLDRDPKLCAQYHNNKHVVKMILESTQLLNNALIARVPDYEPVYRKTHWNHPASVWTRSNLDNFKWLLSLANELCHEYSYRYDKVHKCEQYLIRFSEIDFKDFLSNGKEIEFVQCMPEEYKQNDAVEAYRTYYKKDKVHIASWKRRGIPEWWIGHENDN